MNGGYLPKPRFAAPNQRMLMSRVSVALAQASTYVIVRDEYLDDDFPVMIPGPGELTREQEAACVPGWLLAPFDPPAPVPFIWFDPETGYSSDFRFTIVGGACLDCGDRGGPFPANFCLRCTEEQEKESRLVKADRLARQVVGQLSLEDQHNLYRLLTDADSAQSLRDQLTTNLKSEGLIDG